MVTVAQEGIYKQEIPNGIRTDSFRSAEMRRSLPILLLLLLLLLCLIFLLHVT